MPMSPQQPAAASKWSHPGLQRALLLVCLAVVLAHGLSVADRRAQHAGDFDISREFGRRFLAGEPLYAGGLHYPYLPSAALYFSPLALVPPNVGIALRYALALGCLWLTLWWLERLVARRHPGVSAERTSISVLTVLLASHYLIRDFDDGGPHVILLAIVVAAIAAAGSTRNMLAGLGFGLATAIKAPMALFLPFFLWKRRWRLAAWTALGTTVWIVLPALWMGAGNWWAHQRQWATVVTASAVGTPLPSAAENERRPQNQALRPALMRYLAPATQDPPHPPDAFTMPHAAANALVTVAMVALVAGCCWRDTRNTTRLAAGADDGRWLVECSAVLILCLLLAPLAWVQHLVLLLPALYLIVAEQRAGRPLGTPAAVALAAYALLSLGLNRELLGRDAYVFLLAAGLHTVCILLILAILVLRCPTAGAAR